MKQLSDELIELFQSYQPKLNTWLQTVCGIGHKIESSNGTVGYYTDRHGFELIANHASDATNYTVKRGVSTFAVSDTNGVSAYIYLAGNAVYQSAFDDVATIAYPLQLTLVGDAENIGDYASALAFFLNRNVAIDNVTVNYDKLKNLETAVKMSRRTRNTATGVANISFTFTIQQSANCLILTNCQ